MMNAYTPKPPEFTAIQFTDQASAREIGEMLDTIDFEVFAIGNGPLKMRVNKPALEIIITNGQWIVRSPEGALSVWDARKFTNAFMVLA